MEGCRKEENEYEEEAKNEEEAKEEIMQEREPERIRSRRWKEEKEE